MEEMTSSYKSVFVDTNLDTHLALIVDTASDTVSDLKRKILQEHQLCFPALGEVEIQALKVKRGGHLYHLSQSMLVKHAFHGINKNWFVRVDASSLKGCGDDDDHDDRDRATFGPDCNNNQLPLVDIASGGLAGSRVKVLQDAHPGEYPIAAVVFPVNEHDQSVKEKASSCSDTQCKVISLDALPQIASSHDAHNNVHIRVAEDNIRYDVDKALDIILQPPGVPEADSNEKRKRESKKRKKRAEETDPLVPEQRGKNLADLDNTVVESLAGNPNVADGPSMNASSDADRRLNSKEPRAEVADATGEFVKSRNDKPKSIIASELEDETKILSDAKKKHKIEKPNGKEDSTRENRNLEGFHSPIPKSDKKKSRKKSVNHVNHESVATPSPEVDIRSENIGVATRIDVFKISDGASIMKDTIAEGLDPVRSPSYKDHPSKNVGERHHLTTKGSSDRQEGSEFSQHENLLLNDHQILETDRTQRVEEVGVMHNNEVDGTLQKTGVAGDGGKLSKKRKKSKATKDSASKSPMTSGVEHAKGPGNDTSSNEPNKAINGQLTVCEVNNEVDSPHEDMKYAMSSAARVADGEICDNVTSKESGDRQEDSRFSQHENLILNHHQLLGADGTQKVEEGVPLLCNKEVDGTSHMTGVTIDGGRLSKKRKKTKGARDSVSEAPKTSDAERAECFGNHKDRKIARPSTAGFADGKIDDNVTSKESGDQHEDSGFSQSEKLILNDHQILETSRTERVEERVALLCDEVDRTSHKSSVTVNGGKSSKKRKKTKGARDSVCDTPRTSGAEHAKGPGNDTSSNEPNGAINDYLIVDVGKKEVDLPHEDRKNTASSAVASRVAAREHDDNIQIEIGSVCQIENPQASVESIDGKSRKKYKKKCSSNERKLPAALAENESANYEGTEQMNKMIRDIAESSLKMMEKTGADNKSNETQLNGLNTSYYNRAGVKDNLPGAQLSSVAIAPSQDQGNNRGRHLEPVDKDNRAKAGHEDGSSTDMEASSRSGEINFKDYFAPSQSLENVASGEVFVDARGKTKETNGKVKAVEDKKKLLFNFHDTPRNKVLHSSKVSKQKMMKENNFVGGRNFSAFNTGEVVDSSEQEKRLMRTSGAIFKDEADGIDANGEALGSSDSSTGTSSDTSESSDFSDGETNSDLNSLQRGSCSIKKTKDGGRKLTKSILAGMSLDEILRSSSSYKKAKLNASQSQLDDTESQPVDFVPDTQPYL